MTPNDLSLSKEALKLYKQLKIDRKINLKEIPENRAGDELFAYFLFLHNHGRAPTNQMLFNDVLYRIKTTEEILDPLRVFVSDKEFVKIFVKATIGDEYNVPTLEVLRDANEIDSFVFPPICCIKPTHLSGAVIVRTNGEEIDKKLINSWFSENFYKSGREANYKTLKPKVIIEPLIFNNVNVNDYKFFCFKGKVKLVQVDVDRRKKHQRKMFDVIWTPQDFSIGFPMTTKEINKPKNFKEMVFVVESLAKFFGFIRVDLYSNGDKCLIGEITNCHGNATERFFPANGEVKASEILFTI